jgi:predicted nuclease with TOPRIM domain
MIYKGTLAYDLFSMFKVDKYGDWLNLIGEENLQKLCVYIDENCGLGSEIEDLKTKIDNMDDTWHEELNSIESECSSIEAENYDLTLRNEELEETVAELEDEVRLLTQDIVRLEGLLAIPGVSDGV